MVVAKDQSRALVNLVQVRSRSQRRAARLALPGLCEEARYKNEVTGEVRTGRGWRCGGLLLPVLEQDFAGALIPLTRLD